jgi:hypothetical protein
MNIGAMLVLVKLFQDAVGSVSPIGPPAPNDDKIHELCYRPGPDRKLTFPCWQKYVEPGGSYLDWQDYLTGR